MLAIKICNILHFAVYLQGSVDLKTSLAIFIDFLTRKKRIASLESVSTTSHRHGPTLPQSWPFIGCIENNTGDDPPHGT